MIPKKKSIPKKKVLFTILGEVKLVEGRKRFVPKSIHHLNACISRFPVGKKVSATFSEMRYMRSDSQLRFHRVLCAYIAEHTGFTPDEVHEWCMRIALGEKDVTIDGRTVKIRKSMAVEGDVMKNEAVELISFDLEVCADLEITVPTREELGYLPG
jgi:hypothetical protein